MHKKFEINRTNIKGGCHLERKVETHNSKSDLSLATNLFLTICGCMRKCFKVIVCSCSAAGSAETYTESSAGSNLSFEEPRISIFFAFKLFYSPVFQVFKKDLLLCQKSWLQENW